MENSQQPSLAQAYRAPSSTDTADYRIRTDPNPLQEDPDVEEDVFYRVTPGSQVIVAQLNTCARNFSAYYGVWSRRAQQVMGSWAKSGQHMRLSSQDLEVQSLPAGANNVLVTVLTREGRQGGHCFVSQWMHGEDRVWWITQLLVLPRYRNQMRATRMLQALTRHFDIGKKPSQRDYVGVASSHPYTICAVLRVFSRGIESLPSRPDWERNPFECPHVPLPSSRCEPILKTAPVKHIRDAAVAPAALVADTRFFVDHEVPMQALQRVVHGINKQVREPWQWLFGELPVGHEYLCILEFRHDPEYKMERRLRKSAFVSGEKIQSERGVGTTSFSTLFGQLKSASKPSSPIKYADINRHLLDVSCLHRLDPETCQQVFRSASNSTKTRIVEGKELLVRQPFMLEDIMGAKKIPADLREAYNEKQVRLPDFLPTWRDFWIHSYAVAASEEYDQVSLIEARRIDRRLLTLQAIHFQELLDEQEAMRKGVEIRKAELEEKRMKERRKGVRVRSEERKPLTSLTTNATASLRSAGLLPSLAEFKPTSVTASKRQARYLLTPLVRRKPTKPSPTSNSTSLATRQTKSRLDAGYIKANQTAGPREKMTRPASATKNEGAEQRMSMAPQRTSKLTPMFPRRKLQSTTAGPSIPPTTSQTLTALPKKLTNRQCTSLPLIPIPQSTRTASRPSYMSPTRSSAQRYAAPSPQLFFSDGSSDECSRVTPSRKFPKNAGKVLQRGRVG